MEFFFKKRPPNDWKLADAFKILIDKDKLQYRCKKQWRSQRLFKKETNAVIMWKGTNMKQAVWPYLVWKLIGNSLNTF